MSYDTAEFAVDCIEQWLNAFAQKRYSDIRELLILCNGGGSKGVHVKFWKYALYQQIIKRYGICVRVCHYPTGASKWNPVEHRYGYDFHGTVTLGAQQGIVIVDFLDQPCPIPSELLR